MPKFYVNTYMPLVAAKAGRDAAAQFGLPPFIDGSIRREPDLEHEFPAISCLCRGDKFAPRLTTGDLVAYMTKKASYGRRIRHWRLTALLRVLVSFPSHAAAAAWYRERNLPLPSNCWVRGNPAQPFERSHRVYRSTSCASAARTYREWDASYRLRSMKFGTFVVCEPLFRNLSWNAPVVDDKAMVQVFGKVPGTHNPGARTFDECDSLTKRLGLEIPLSGP